MKNTHLYLFGDPHGKPDTKIGVSGDIISRLTTFQSGASPRSHDAKFDVVWDGPIKDIHALESSIKKQYKKYIVSHSAGRSEWITKHTPDKLEKNIDIIIKNNGYRIKKLPARFFPVTLDNYKKVVAFTRAPNNRK